MTKSVGWLVEVLHEDGELPVGVAQLPGHRLPLEDQGADLDEVLVALHALVVPEMNDIDSSGYFQILQHLTYSCVARGIIKTTLE